MKKTFTYLLVLLATFSYNYSEAQPFGISAPSNVCLGGTTGTCNALVTPTMAGATSYSWTAVSGANSASITQLSGMNGTNVAINFTTCGAYTITCTAYNGVSIVAGPFVTYTSVYCMPQPTVVAFSSGTNVCAGDPFNLIAQGANSYTWVPGAFTASNFTLYPTSSTCFTVSGTNSYACISSAVICVSVSPVPTLQVIGTTTACAGTSMLLTATGANSYMWSIGVTTASIVVTPSVATCYSVIGAAANGCTAMVSSCVMPIFTCSDVWPGDANSDGIVDNTDVFEIGLAFSSTGAARNPGGNAYVAQFATNWTGTISTYKNKCHADCNGDGTINNGDTLAIYNNYSLTHAFKPSDVASVGDINLVTNQPFVNGGQWNKADIVIGSSTNPLSQLYGLAYDLNFDKTLIVPDSIYIVYTSSFFNNSNVNFRKNVFNSNIIHSASVRTNGTNASGNGKIGELWFKVKTGLAANTQINLSISNAKKIDATGSPVILAGGSNALSVVNTNTGLESINSLKNVINLFPNPTSKKLTMQNNAGTEIQYSLFDITGREILNGSFNGSKTVDVTELSAGAYLMRFTNNSETSYKKLVIEK